MRIALLIAAAAGGLALCAAGCDGHPASPRVPVVTDLPDMKPTTPKQAVTGLLQCFRVAQTARAIEDRQLLKGAYETILKYAAVERLAATAPEPIPAHKEALYAELFFQRLEAATAYYLDDFVGAGQMESRQTGPRTAEVIVPVKSGPTRLRVEVHQRDDERWGVVGARYMPRGA